MSRPSPPGETTLASPPLPRALTIAQVASAFDLRGQRVLLTGAASDIGRATALALAIAGATVLACDGANPNSDINNDEYDLVRALKETGGDHRLLHDDVCEPNGIATLIDSCREHLGTVQILVNILVPPNGSADAIPFAALTPSQWRSTLDAGLTSAAMVTHAALPLLTAGSSIVNVCTTVDSQGRRGSGGGSTNTADATVAAGLAGLTRSLARELGPTDTRVNLVAVGPAAASRAEHVAAVVLFLASAGAAGITGETFVVDGGA